MAAVYLWRASVESSKCEYVQVVWDSDKRRAFSKLHQNTKVADSVLHGAFSEEQLEDDYDLNVRIGAGEGFHIVRLQQFELDVL